jgi:hypothetical protein
MTRLVIYRAGESVNLVPVIPRPANNYCSGEPIRTARVVWSSLAKGDVDIAEALDGFLADGILAGPDSLLRRHPAPASVVILIGATISAFRSNVKISVVPLLIVPIGSILIRLIKIAVALLRASAARVRASLVIV